MTEFPDFPMPRQQCPVCGYNFDAATNVFGSGEPGPLDLTVCLNCATPLRWNLQMQIEVLEKDDLKDINTETLMALLDTCKAVQGLGMRSERRARRN